MRVTSSVLSAFIGLMLVGAGLASAAQDAKTIVLPAANNAFKDGPNIALAREYCLACHSSDYVYIQPTLTRAVWVAEVKKMKAAYGAQIPDDAIEPLADYLTSQNGKP